MTSPNAAGCAAHLNQLQQNECYYYSNDCVKEGDDHLPCQPPSDTQPIGKPCTVVEHGRVVVKPISN
jgi:hypothetical protein